MQRPAVARTYVQASNSDSTEDVADFATRRNRPARFLQSLAAFKLKKPKTVVLLLLWAFGLFSVFLAPPPRALDENALMRFDAKLKAMEATSEERSRARDVWQAAQMDLAEARYWFWQLNKTQRRVVQERRAAEREAWNIVRSHEQHRQRLLSDAKAALGLWSEAGVDEGRRLFWQSFEAGKVFGRRQTFWDTAYSLLLSRADRNLVGSLIELCVTAVINFTAGMLCSIFVFVFQLPSLLLSYQAGLVSGAAFFAVALLGALSVVTAFLLALYASSAAAIYATATVATGRLDFATARYRYRLGRDHF